MAPIEGVTLIQGDITSAATAAEVRCRAESEAPCPPRQGSSHAYTHGRQLDQPHLATDVWVLRQRGTLTPPQMHTS